MQRVYLRVCATSCLVAGMAVLADAQPQLGPRTPLPILPLTQLDDRTLSVELDNRAFNLTFAQPVAVRDLLLLLVRGTALSVVPDPAISGTFIGELKGVTVRQALDLILPPLGLAYAVDGSIVRVFRREPETRLFDINYVAAARVGEVRVGGRNTGGAFARVSTTTSTDLFADLTAGVRALLSEGATFNVDRKAGLLQVTDFPERLDRVGRYLDTVHDRVHRQVQIDARVIEVELTEPSADSLDWEKLAQDSIATPGAPASRPAINGLRVGDVPRFLAALAAQGAVSVLASPRIIVLNNEPAVLRAGSEGGETREDPRVREPEVRLAVTPQISDDGVVMLSMSPTVGLFAIDQKGKTPVSAYREADTLARVADGDTIVIAGFKREREVRERRVGRGGGWFGRSTVVTRKRVELMVLITPRIL